MQKRTPGRNLKITQRSHNSSFILFSFFESQKCRIDVRQEGRCKVCDVYHAWQLLYIADISVYYFQRHHKLKEKK